MVSPEQLPPQSPLRRAKENIEKIFNDNQVRLVDRFTSRTEKTIAILGAGLAIEVPALNDCFVAQGFERPRIIAFDKNESGKSLTEEFAGLYGVSVDYRIADVSNESTFGNEQYDLVIVRKPDIHNSQEGWAKVFENAFHHLKDAGLIVVTTSEDKAYDFTFLELTRNGEIVLNYQIPSHLRVLPFISEFDLLIFRKRR